jgi:radical SAM superfamily enzyme YgiQ (UPF0313 family)
MAFLKKYLKVEHEVTAVDINFAAFNEYIPTERSFEESIRSTIADNEYDLLLVSTQFMFNQGWVDFIVEESRKKTTESQIVVGGGFSTIFPERSVSAPGVTWGIIGEGEHTQVHVINRILGMEDPDFEALFPFDGYIQSDGNGNVLAHVPKTKPIKDLSLLPIPDWDWLEPSRYVSRMPQLRLPVMTTRGCPNSCSYCSTQLYWSRSFRYRPWRDVVEEIARNQSRYGVEGSHVVDDNPAFDKRWFLDFCGAIAEAGNLNVSFSNFSVKTINAEVLDALRKVNLERLVIAIETGSEEMQKKTRKRLQFDKVLQTVDLIREKGFDLHVCWMIGFPNESLEQIEATIRLARKIRSESMQIFPVFPFPGTELYDEAQRQGLVEFDELDFQTMHNRHAGHILSDEWTGEDLTRIAYDANIELNFLKTPLLDTPKGRERLLNMVEALTHRIEAHVVAHIVAGYLHQQVNNASDAKERHYSLAKSCLEKDQTFAKYVEWSSVPTDDFRQWMKDA